MVQKLQIGTERACYILIDVLLVTVKVSNSPFL